MSLLASAMAQFQAHPHVIDKFSESLQPDLIADALKATGTASVRRRKLPAEQVVWLTVGMAMFTNTSIRQTLDRLNLLVNGKVVPSTVSDARKRLGPKPLSYLFALLARSWGDQISSESTWRGLRLFGLDGTMIRVPDSDENAVRFGKPGSDRAEAAYPQARVVAAMDLGQRLLHSARIGTLSQGESTLASGMFDDLPPNSLCLMDRGFLSFAHFHRFYEKGGHRNFLCRARSNSRFAVKQVLPDGSYIATMCASPQARKKDPGMQPEITIRVIEYVVQGHGQVRLVTSLLDHKKYPRRNMAHLYHERWEIEIAFDELKTDMLNRNESLRSQAPEGVEQEIWAMFLTYNLVRREMALTALAHSARPSVMSFKASLVFITDFFIIHASDPATGRLPERLRLLRDELWRYRLPPRRSDRSAPRHVKIKMSSYPKKPPRARRAVSDA